MLKKYISYLEFLNKRLAGYFEDQKDFLKCKAGCDICCTNSYYPTSALEYEYVRTGFNKTFSEEEKEKINQTAISIIKDRRQFAKTNPDLDVWAYSYKCPFLKNGKCGVYEYRPLLCRTHGLIYKDVDKPDKNNAPYCMRIGLNYANVYDSETKQFSDEKAESLGIKTIPNTYDLSYSVLLREAKNITENPDLDFGDVRMIVEWIVMDIPNYQELI